MERIIADRSRRVGELLLVCIIITRKEAESVLLDIEAWRKTIIDPYQWLTAGTYMVGARVPEGVIGVMDGQRPMLRKVSGESDRLGRKEAQGAEEPTPWFMRTL